MYFGIIFPILTAVVFFKCDGPSICNHYFGSTWKKWKRLNKLVSSRQKNKLKIIYVSLKLIIMALHIKLLQLINNSLKQIDKNNYELTYEVEGRTYIHKFKIKRGPKPIILAHDEFQNDITELILSHLGPELNWHGHSAITPDYFGKCLITLYMSDGSELTFRYHEPLVFNL